MKFKNYERIFVATAFPDKIARRNFHGKQLYFRKTIEIDINEISQHSSLTLWYDLRR